MTAAWETHIRRCSAVLTKSQHHDFLRGQGRPSGPELWWCCRVNLSVVYVHQGHRHYNTCSTSLFTASLALFRLIPRHNRASLCCLHYFLMICKPGVNCRLWGEVGPDPHWNEETRFLVSHFRFYRPFWRHRLMWVKSLQSLRSIGVYYINKNHRPEA